MLAALSIRDLVLIDRLDLEFQPGLTVLTGETGAGKSILLNAVAFVTGARGDRSAVRSGAESAHVTARFDLPNGHPVWAVLAEAGFDGGDGELLLRRVIPRDGSSRAFVNDAPASAGLLQSLGGLLLERHGQHDDRALLAPSAHRPLLDRFGALTPDLQRTADCYQRKRDAEAALERARTSLAQSAAERDYLNHLVRELSELAPQAGEEASLAEERALLMNGEKIVEDLEEAVKAVNSDAGLAKGLAVAARKLERVNAQVDGQLSPVLAALERALTEVTEAHRAVNAAFDSLEFDPKRLEAMEERLFALRAAARKYHCPVDRLPELLAEADEKRAALNAGESGLKALEEARDAAEKAYRQAAERLTAARGKAAVALDQAVNKELAPLKLGRAKFVTELHPLPESQRGAEGADRVRFTAQTNPGSPGGPIDQVASGGELARFTLALRTVLAGQGSACTLVFDEVDRGVSGAVADAVGARLARLAAGPGTQVLVVTHSPQVAARAGTHLQTAKHVRKGQTITAVTVLEPEARIEEVARMLSGAQVTEEARAAAARLIAAAEEGAGVPPRRPARGTQKRRAHG